MIKLCKNGAAMHISKWINESLLHHEGREWPECDGKLEQDPNQVANQPKVESIDVIKRLVVEVVLTRGLLGTPQL